MINLITYKKSNNFKKYAPNGELLIKNLIITINTISYIYRCNQNNIKRSIII